MGSNFENAALVEAKDQTLNIELGAYDVDVFRFPPAEDGKRYRLSLTGTTNLFMNASGFGDTAFSLSDEKGKAVSVESPLNKIMIFSGPAYLTVYGEGTVDTRYDEFSVRVELID